jgi:hypothetical protein
MLFVWKVTAETQNVQDLEIVEVCTVSEYLKEMAL